MTPPDDPSTQRSKGRQRLLALFLAVVVLPLAVELLLRLVGYSHPRLVAPVVVWDVERDAAMAAEADLHEARPEVLWQPRPGAPIPGADGETVNALGLRGPLPSDAARARVTTLGDSTCFGWEVPYAESYAGRLDAELGPEVELLSAGVIGYTVVQGRQRFRASVAEHDPRVAVLAFGAANEHFPSDVGGDRERIALLQQRASWMTDLVVAAYDASRIVQAIGQLAERQRGGREVLVERWKAERARYDAEFARRGELDFDGDRRVEVDEFERELTEFVEELRGLGIAPVLLAGPRRAGFEAERPILPLYDAALRRVAEATGAPLADAHTAFRADPRGEEALFVDPLHPTAAGHAVIAELLLPLVREALAAPVRGR